jgi:hypothetical protein
MCLGSNTNGGIPGAFSPTAQQEDSFLSASILKANLGKPSFNGFITYDAPILGNPITGYGPNGVEIFGQGVRNPYSVLKHSNGFVYATANGPNLGFGEFFWIFPLLFCRRTVSNRVAHPYCYFLKDECLMVVGYVPMIKRIEALHWEFTSL